MSNQLESADNKHIASEIAARLEEQNPYALVQIERIIECVGVEATHALLDETLHIEATGGMLTNDKKRRRSPGGVFFYLIRGRVSPEDRKIIFPYPRQRKKEGGPPKPPPRPLKLNLEARRELLRELRKPGEANTVKLTLIGRPAKILDRNQFVVITMTGKEPPALPKGLPSLPNDDPTIYLIYIAQKQWKRVSEAIKHPDDRLIIEGYPFNDKRLGVIGVLAQSTTTVNLQRAKQTETTPDL